MATTIQIVSLGANGWRRSVRCVSERSRSSLAALHGRQEATTFSQTCSPPRERGTTWSMFSAVAPQYWQRGPSRTKTDRRGHGGPGPEGHADEVDETDDGRHGEGHALRMQLFVAVLEHLGLLLQHEDHGPPNRHDTERLVGGVEHERSPQAPPLLYSRPRCR